MSTYFGSAKLLGHYPTHLQQKFIDFIFSYATQKILSLSGKKRAAFQMLKIGLWSSCAFVWWKCLSFAEGRLGWITGPSDTLKIFYW
jgi:hypothetical protein